MKLHVVVIVLGDLGRSPRMQYHAASLVQMDDIETVTLVGYEGENIMSGLKSNPKLKEKRIKSINLNFLRFISAGFHAFLKGIILLIRVFFSLLEVSPYDIIIVQNPPSFPVLIAAFILNILFLAKRRSIIILDWHNLGYSLFPSYKGSSLLSGNDTLNNLPIEPVQQSTIVRFARFCEIYGAKLTVDYHICVSNALKRYLQLKMPAAKVTVLYDRPFNTLPDVNEFSVQRRHDLLLKYSLVDNSNLDVDSAIDSTIQTKHFLDDNKHTYHLRNDRAFVIVSSTSWTPDEDFGLLIDTILLLDFYLRKINDSKVTREQHKIVVIITGKGPLRPSFESKIKELEEQGNLLFIKVKCLWLSSSDYFELLSYADVGICLHTSSSGLDLPMKVLDMLGAKLVVLAARFYSISELIQDGENGILFDTYKDLAANILRLMLNPNVIQTGIISDSILPLLEKQSNVLSLENENRTFGSQELSFLRQRVMDNKFDNWHENWNMIMKPLVEDIIANPVQHIGYQFVFLVTLLTFLAFLMACMSYYISTKSIT